MTTDFQADFGLDGPAKPTTVKEPSREGWRLIYDVDLNDYYADAIAPQPSISNSGMTRLLGETPLDFAYHHPRLNPEAVKEAKATTAQRRGDVVHQLALGKGRGYFILPDTFMDFKKGAAQDLRDAALDRGETPVLAHKFEEAEVLAEVIKERIVEALDGAAYDTEVAFLYQEQTEAGPIWVRGLMDVWCEERAIILDPKISAMLYPGKVEKHFLNMGWDRQASLYPHAMGMIFPHIAGRVEFADLMVKPEAPYTSRVVGLDQGWEHSSIRQCKMAFERFGACLYAGRWPGYGSDVERIVMPGWEDKRREIQELGAQ